MHRGGGVLSSDSGAQTPKTPKTPQTPQNSKTANIANTPDPKDQTTPSTSFGNNREATPAEKPQANSTVELSQEKKDTLPNMYAWGSSDNVYIKDSQNQSITFNLKPTAGSTITKVAIFPSDAEELEVDNIINENSSKFVEYYSGDTNAHQAYSGEYGLVTNQDGSATLTMNKLYRDNKMAAEKYQANRCIYVYGKGSDGKEVLLYKTNVVRAATIIPPKKTGSIVLKYDEELTEDQIQAKLKEALDAPTAAKDGKSVRDQIKTASTAFGVGVRPADSGPVVPAQDDPDKKVVITDKRAYDVNQFNRINKVTSQQGAAVTTYTTGVQNLKTYLVSDLGYKSGELALTVARYDTRIDKPTVDDLSKVSDEVKTEIRRKLAHLNHVSEDKVTINDQGEVSINFTDVDAKDAPKIALSELVLKKIAETGISVPAGDKAVFVANPLGYSKAELDRIKQSIFDANKNNDELGLTSVDQITLSYIEGDTVTAGHKNQGISNGQAENKITVKIKTDKAVAEFTSDIKANKLTRLPDIRKDYTVSWEASKTKIDGRDSDEGISWSDDSHTTIIYRYDPTKAKEFDTTKILGLLKATPKDDKSGLRELTGGEQLEYEGTGNNARKSHMHYVLQKGEPTTELTLGNMNGAYWEGVQKVSNSDVNLGDAESEAGSYSWDTEAGPVKVAGKKGKIFKARLFVEPYAMSYYKDVYLEKGRHPGNTAKAINVIFVPQTNHKTSDLQKSIGEHKLAADKKTPTESKYYNASDAKKDAYEKALAAAKETLTKVGTTTDANLSEDLKAEVDNATIKLNKARAELDGTDTDKTKLEQSLKDHGKAAEEQTPASGTQATDRYKNVSDPDFKTADGKADDAKNKAAQEAKKAYDEALQAAKAAKDDANATQKAVDAAKAKLDAARDKLNEFTTNKDELNNAIAQHGKVNTGDATQTDPKEKLKTADPTYQNSSDEERKAYDDAVKKANELSKDPNASQKEVNEAIKKLKDAKDALDKNATDKAPLDAAVQKSFDNPDPNNADKQSVFYKNAKNKTDDAAKKAVEDYDRAFAEAKRVLGDKNATKADVDKAKKALEDAEAALHADTYQTNPTDLGKALADNFSGYLMPAYFNAFDKAQADGKDSQAAKDFKAYNDAYHAAKELMAKTKQPGSTVEQKDVDKVKNQLIEARKVIDKYATDTSKISAALLHSLAITNSPAYKNASANTDPNSDEAKAKKAYDDALTELQKAFNDKMDKDVDAQGAEISTDKVPNKDGDTNSASYLDGIQSHAKQQPLNRDVTRLLEKLNKAVEGLDKFKTNTDELIKSINEDATTHPSPAFKNASQPNYQKADGSGADDDKNRAAKAAAEAYGKALNEAKDLLKDPTATQAKVDTAKKTLDEARKALDAYNTDTAKLEKSVAEHGKDADGTNPAIEGTKDSDAYRNASDPHFVDENGKPDEAKNQQARDAKTAYDKALADAQELIAKHNDANTPQDAKPTQAEIDAALSKLDDARKTLVGDDGALDKPGFGTKTTDLDAEIAKSSAADATTPTPGTVEDTTAYKNALAKTTEDGKENPDITKYKEALKKARELAEKKKSTKASERPLQKDVDEAYHALLDAKKIIDEQYKTDATALQDEAALGANDGNFTKSPEYKNADAKKADDGSDNAELKAYKDALTEVQNMLNNFGKDGKPNAGVGDQDLPTQAQVNEALDKLSKARKAVEEKYKTNTDALKNEIGDKDDKGNKITPPFEASVPYKNALDKANAESEEDAKKDTSATKKLKAYADKLKEANDLIEKVKNPDPNAKPEDRPTQKQVDDALKALKKAKKDIDDNFKTKVEKLQNEVDDKNEDGTARTPKFEESTEFANLKAKQEGDKEPEDLTAYKQALAKAKELIDKNDGKIKNDQGQEVDVPKEQLPTQAEVDEAQKALKEIKDKILANYKTNPHDLSEEAKMSKFGDADKRDTTFENSAAFKNASAKADDEAAKKALKDYTDALAAANKLLAAFDLTKGGVKPKLPDGMAKAPTQKELDEALKALQDAKAKIEKDYATKKEDLTTEYDERKKEHSSDYSMASGHAQKVYTDALNDAQKVLNNKNATQAEVDDALQKLKAALKALEQSASANRLAGYATIVADSRDALRKLVEANASTHLKALFTQADAASQREFIAAMDNAKQLLADQDALATELDAARVRLLKALAELAKHQLPNSGDAFANASAAAEDADATGAARAAGKAARSAKHLAQTSDPTNALAAAGFLASALGFITMGFKTKKRREK